MVLSEYGTNAILTKPLKNQTVGKILWGYQKLHQYLVRQGYNPQTHWLENEASSALKTYNQQNSIEYQLVPPHHHCRNAAERAIHTWKNTSLRDCAALTPNSQCTYGIASEPLFFQVTIYCPEIPT
jgi:hypothetical protein